MLIEHIQRLCKRIEAFKGSSAVIRLDHAFFALAGDIISRICCEEHTNLIEDEQFSSDWSAIFTTSVGTFH